MYEWLAPYGKLNKFKTNILSPISKIMLENRRLPPFKAPITLKNMNQSLA